MPSVPSRSLLHSLDVRPSKGMGQNFLQDRELAHWIAASLEATDEDVVVEIGPGLGALTEHLAQLPHRKLILLEMDKRLAAHQREVFAGRDDVEVIETDALSADRREFYHYGPIKLIGNLPYNVGTTIAAEWLSSPSPVGRAVFMLQREVCERMAAVPSTKAYGQLSVKLQARWCGEIIKIVPPRVFHPRPSVDSAIIRFDPRPRTDFPVFNDRELARLLAAGFSQRRKQMKNLLPPAPLPWEEVCQRIHRPQTVRAEELTIGEWIEMSRLYDAHPLADIAQKSDEIFDVVDDRDQVVGQATRAEVHRTGLKHRAVHVFAVDKHGQIILQKRSHLKDACPSLWDSSAAGHLDSGEDYAACVVRELEEELGIHGLTEPPRRIAKIEACAMTGWEFVELHSARWDGPCNFPAAEIEAIQAFSPEQIERWIASRPQDFAPGFLRCWEEWRKAEPAQ